MGFSEKAQVEGGLESDSRKWVIAGIALRAPLKPIYTIPVEKEQQDESDMEEECSTTPKGEQARIPTTLTCPRAPRKRKPSLKCNYSGGAREFFTPPDLETVFIRHVERAN
ncbi:cyclin-dependent protein kinase inhibitor SMR6-like [Gastrolobium bilobum]|uniref:cyclin-dependent protein kinase inhibitor SMR6-like n=1 Tax=Gastrolobium bilobum TaxID=150636 RepID=UPI002AB323F1|nr:cyclin-dependent protein kinase inhibitor SMR6-like [Gastrolobium bilobum]